MNTIVVAAIALLVLVIVSVIFIQQMGWFNTKSKDCQSIGGVCQEGGCDEGFAPSASGVCFDADGNKDQAYTCCAALG